MMTMVYYFIFILAISTLFNTSPVCVGVGEVSPHIYIQ